MINRNNKGFTLIELLVVIAVISMLASVVMNYLASARAKGNDTGKIQSLKQVLTAVNMYYGDYGYYPTTGTVLTTANSKNGGQPYIISMPNEVSYTGLTKAGATCNNVATLCDFFHLALPLSENTQAILKRDADYNSAGIKGKSDNCTGNDAVGIEKCYDITPENQ